MASRAVKVDDGHCDASLEMWPLTWQADEEASWVPFSYTHVEYLKGDLFGLVMAIASLLPIFIVVSFVTLVLFRRDLHTIFFFAGTLLNEVSNLILKRALGHLRPCSGRPHHGSKYAMPSNHSQFVWFFAVYLFLFLFLRLEKSTPSSKAKPIEMAWKVIVILVTFSAAGVVSYSRAYLRYHSSTQVIFGSVLGAVFGAMWFVFMQRVLTPLFPVIAGWRWSEFLLIRDTTLIPNVLFFEYTKQREETSIRMRKSRSVGRSY